MDYDTIELVDTQLKMKDSYRNLLSALHISRGLYDFYSANLNDTKLRETLDDINIEIQKLEEVRGMREKEIGALGELIDKIHAQQMLGGNK